MGAILGAQVLRRAGHSEASEAQNRFLPIAYFGRLGVRESRNSPVFNFLEPPGADPHAG
jgi:hypothetical protein